MGNLTYPRQQALQNPETVATVIHAILREQYGEEFYAWDPATIFLEAKADWNAEMCTETMDRMAAVQVFMTTNAFFERLDAFLAICNTLNDGSPFFSDFNPVSLPECAWAIAEVALNREMLPFSYPIRQYIKVLLHQNGYEKGEYPAIFEEVLGKKPNTDDIRDSLGQQSNTDNISSYIDEQLQDMTVQFNRIPDMKGLDDIILQRGLEEAVGENQETV